MCFGESVGEPIHQLYSIARQICASSAPKQQTRTGATNDSRSDAPGKQEEVEEEQGRPAWQHGQTVMVAPVTLIK